MSIKPGQELKTLADKVAGAVVRHPAQRANVVRVTNLIKMLRACNAASDYYEFQRHLFEAVYRVEERRAQCSRVLKRLRRGESLPAGLPPPHEGDPHSVETWELEAYVFERLARQLRTVGDGLAWRCYGYDRRVILALSRNESAGPMFGKKGLGFELGRVEELWKTKGNFALLHDLTNCLRIADLTEFDANGAWLREVKSTPHTNRAQIKRMQVAIDALMHGGPLPGFPSAQFVELSEVYDTNLRQLDDAIKLAKKVWRPWNASTAGASLGRNVAHPVTTPLA